MSVVKQFQDVEVVLDLFSGTSRVGHALKGAGYRVWSNDHNRYAATLARCYVQADRERWLKEAEALLEEASQLPPAPGWFTETFCRQSRFFQPKNGARVDAIREFIKDQGLGEELEAILLVSLMEAADRVDSTTGVQMAYLKKWAPRSHKDLALRLPDLLPASPYGQSRAFELDALEAVTQLDADLVYMDPPYNQHKYLGNYHVWESLVRWDKPEVYGVACKRVDCKERKSDFNSKRRMRTAMEELIGRVRAPHMVVSFSDEGFLDRDELVELLSAKGEVCVFEQPYSRYVGARIGIHDRDGHKVGSVSHVKNTEFLFVVSQNMPKNIEQALEAF